MPWQVFKTKCLTKIAINTTLFLNFMQFLPLSSTEPNTVLSIAKFIGPVPDFTGFQVHSKIDITDMNNKSDVNPSLIA